MFDLWKAERYDFPDYIVKLQVPSLITLWDKFLNQLIQEAIMTSSSTLALPNAPLNILAIDGGAMMGVVPARILQYLEGKISNTSLYNGNTTGPVATPPSPFEIDSLTPLNKQICQAFDLIVGTSTGGLIAFALAVPPGIKGTQDSGLPTEPMSAQAVLDFYFAQSENIFSPNPPNTMLTTKTPLFENGGLINAISSVFGAPAGVVSSNNESPAAPVGTLRHATDAVVPVLVTSYNNNPQFTTQPKATICPILDNSSTQQGPLLIGAVGYVHRGLQESPAKLALVSYLRHRSGLRLEQSSLLKAEKFNLFVWRPQA